VAGGDGGEVFEVHDADLQIRKICQLPRDIDGIACTVHGDILAANTAGLHLISAKDPSIVTSRQRFGALAAIYVSEDLVIVGLHDMPRLVVGRVELTAVYTVRSLELTASVSCGALNAPIFGLADGSIVELQAENVMLLGRTAAEVEAVCVTTVGDHRVVAAVDRMGLLTLIGNGPPQVHRVSRYGDRLKSLVIHPGDGSILFSAGKDRNLYTIDLVKGTVKELQWHHGAGRTFNHLLVTPSGILHAASWDGIIYRGRLTEQGIVEPMSPLRGHTQAVESMLLLDGLMVSTSYDGSVRVWNVAEGTLSCQKQLSSMAIRRACRGSSQTSVWTASYDGVVREFNVAGDVAADATLRTWDVMP